MHCASPLAEKAWSLGSHHGCVPSCRPPRPRSSGVRALSCHNFCSRSPHVGAGTGRYFVHFVSVKSRCKGVVSHETASVRSRIDCVCRIIRCTRGRFWAPPPAPVYAAPPPPPVYPIYSIFSWSGIYVGINGGGALLKVGSDAFLATGRPPTVAVCDQRYVFNPVVTGDLDPNASCPPSVEANPVSIVQMPLPATSALVSSALAPPAPRMGTFCHTQAGRFGPGLAQPLGSSCVANAPWGQLAGQIGL